MIPSSLRSKILVFIAFIDKVKVISSCKSIISFLSPFSGDVASLYTLILYNKFDTLSIKSLGKFLISLSFKLLMYFKSESFIILLFSTK